MLKIDLKDRKILYELDLDARQSLTQVGKKVGLKKDVVSYRIKRMQDEGVINNFLTAINTFKLGYHVYRIYISFQYVSLNKKNEIIQHFCKYKNIWTVITVKADVDLDVIVWVDDVYEFYKFWYRTLDLFGEYFAKYIISILIQSYAYKKSYLLSDEGNKPEREMYITTCTGKPVEIEELDYQLLNQIAVNARMPLIDLAENLGCSSQTVNYRLKNLQKVGVIQAFRIGIDLKKLGLQHYKYEIYLGNYKNAKEIWNYLKNKSYLTFLNVAIGWCDLEFEVVVENVDKLSQIMDEINLKFPNSIKKQVFWIIEKMHIDRWLPEFSEKQNI